MIGTSACVSSARTSTRPGSEAGMLPTPKVRRMTASGWGVVMARSRAALIPGTTSMTATSWRLYGLGSCQPVPALGASYQRHGAPVRAMGDTEGDSNPRNAHDEVLVARLPARSLCPKNSMTPRARCDIAARRAPVTFADASEPTTPSGY